MNTRKASKFPVAPITMTTGVKYRLSCFITRLKVSFVGRSVISTHGKVRFIWAASSVKFPWPIDPLILLVLDTDSLP